MIGRGKGGGIGRVSSEVIHAAAVTALTPRRIDELREFGVLTGCMPTVGLPGDGSCGALYVDWISREVARTCKPHFDVFRRVRMILGASHLPIPDTVVSQLIDVAAPRAVTEYLINKYLGPKQIAPVLRAVARLNGAGKRAQVRAGGIASLHEVLAMFADEERHAFLSLLQGGAEAPPELDGNLAGRVVQMPDCAWRKLTAALLLQAVADGVKRARQSTIVAMGERMAVIIPEAGQRDVAATTWAVDEYASGGEPLDLPAVRARTAGSHFSAVNAGAKLMIRLGICGRDDADGWLPSHHTDGRRFAKAQQALNDVRTDARKETNKERRVQLAGLKDALIEVVDARIGQIEALSAACNAAVAADRPQAGSPYWKEISCRTEILTAGGVRTAGLQDVRLVIANELALLEATAELAPGDAELAWRLGRAERPPSDTGLYPEPGDRSRLHVLYKDAAPLEGCDAACEPFFVELFRWWMIEPEAGLDGDRSLERARRIKEKGWQLEEPVPAGFLHDDESRRSAIRACRGYLEQNGYVILPLTSFLHAMLCGGAVIRMGAQAGARLGETMQLRLGADCINREYIDGRWRMIAHLTPKGWEHFGKFEIDGETLHMLDRIRSLASSRWNFGVDSKGRPDLPVREYSKYDRALPAARYLFTGKTAMLRHDVFQLFFNILLSGAIGLRSDQRIRAHDPRYVFATVAGIDGLTYRSIGERLHHLVGSLLTPEYVLDKRLVLQARSEHRTGKVA